MSIDHENQQVRNAMCELAGALFGHCRTVGRSALLILLDLDGSELRVNVTPNGILVLPDLITTRDALRAFRLRRREYLARQAALAEVKIQAQADDARIIELNAPPDAEGEFKI